MHVFMLESKKKKKKKITTIMNISHYSNMKKNERPMELNHVDVSRASC